MSVKETGAGKRRKFLTNVSWIVGMKILQMLLGLIFSAWTARYLGPSDLGTISYVASFVSFFTSIATLGLNNIIIKELQDHEDEQGKVLGTGILMRIAASIFSAVCIVAIVCALNGNDPELRKIAVIESIYLAFSSFELITYWYHNRLESKVASIIQTIAYIGMSIYRVFCLTQGKNIYWFSFNDSLNAIIMAFLLYLSFRRYSSQPMGWDSKLWKQMLSKSHHFIASGLMVAIYSEMDKIMIKGWMDSYSVGQYSIASGINTLWAFILQALIDSAYSIIVEEYRRGDRETYHRRIIQLYSAVFWFSIFVSALITIFAKPVILILYGSQYLPAVNCLRVTTWINTFAYLGVARGAWMVCEDNQSYQKWILGIGSLVNIVLNSLWIPSLGIEGAALATVVTQVVTSMIAPLFFARTRENTGFILQAMHPKVLKELIRRN